MASGLWLLPWRVGVAGLIAALVGLGVDMKQFTLTERRRGREFPVAGVQVEFPIDLEVPGLLDQALAQCPGAELFMLSGSAFDGPVPPRVKQWCKNHQCYLVAGGKDSISLGILQYRLRHWPVRGDGV